MEELIISDLKGVIKEHIECLEQWLANIKSGRWKAGKKCPFSNHICCCGVCYLMFDNLEYTCPCSTFGEKGTQIAFRIICDIWKADTI